MTHPLLQTVAGSSDTVSACLLCKAAGVGVLVTNPTTGVMVKARPEPALPFTGQVPFSAPSPLAI
jgi:hypothetical protein